MSGFEFGEHGRYILAPRKNFAAVIIDQTMRSRPQIIELARFYFLTFSNCSQCGLRHAAMRPLCFEIFYCLIVVRRVSFTAG
jgi:hypothetical protein